MNSATHTLIGLTGGIGSGKSTVATMLGEVGATVLDADLIARTITLPNGAAIPAIRQAFGDEMISADGSLNREAMRSRVFADPAAKHTLEHITHPLIGLAIANAIAAIHSGTIVLDIPLLAESDRWQKQLAAVIVVDCPVQLQIDRVAARNGWPIDAIQAIIQSQARRSTRLALADAVLFNDGLSLNALREQVQQLASRLGI